MTAISQTRKINKTALIKRAKYVLRLRGNSVTVYGFEIFMPKYKELMNSLHL